jgi:hypothetical protein
MNLRNYLFLSALVFLVIAFIHLVRAVAGWVIVVGPVNIPLVFSWLAALAMAILGVLALQFAKGLSEKT